ncbi:formylglycine-generating enzyme family protein [Candidatus Magnetomonas plexicatena]|uniref:formylglycine-generating enzyme family protein n=1 Tax=Candidatus Magnetomonas plexicatena TaxID=2552947 RepID=UPI001C76524D|nr:formylglycine-generating enzyme family protein [Nitrospirales bacterium LBB_01]
MDDVEINEQKDVIRYTDVLTGMEFVFVVGGCYQMGDMFGDGFKNEKPVHEVCVDDFYIGTYPVTQSQWVSVMGSNPSEFKFGDNYPVERVSRKDVMKFIDRLNELTGMVYRLPTEAEWEYACRSGGRKEKYSGGNAADKYAWYGSNSGNGTSPVGRKKSNGLCIYDMSGNVWEWVADLYNTDAYSKHTRSNPINKDSGIEYVIRGGSWSSIVEYVRCPNRQDAGPGRILN